MGADGGRGALTRASYSTRSLWFQSLAWFRVSRTLCGLRPTPPEDKSAGGLEKIARPAAFDVQYGHLLVQPGDTSRLLGVKSFQQFPAFGGEVPEEIAQQSGYRVPEASPFEEGTNSRLRFAASDPDAALTVPSASIVKQPVGTGVQEALVRNNAELLRKLPVAHIGDCSSDPDAAVAVAKNACVYCAKYEKGFGFRRCAPRLRGAIARAALLPLDSPKSGTSPGWFLREVLSKECVASRLRAQPYRLAVGAPSSHPFRGSLDSGRSCWWRAGRHRPRAVGKK